MGNGLAWRCVVDGASGAANALRKGIALIDVGVGLVARGLQFP